MGLCKFCGADGPLHRSHILPEFVYAPIYNEHNKGFVFDPRAPDNKKKFQKGIWEQMLCLRCEQFLNDEYEKPFKALWFDQRVLACLETCDYAILDCGEYDRFKLFHLSVLLRAELTQRPEFGEVSLGDRHRAQLLDMVRTGRPGEAWEYPIVCFAVKNPTDDGIWWDFVSSPNPGRVFGARFYQFTFGGCAWMYFVASHRNPEIEKIAFRADGTLPVAKKPWPAAKRFAPHATFGHPSSAL